MENKPYKITYSKSISKRIERSNARADKGAKKAEKFEIKNIAKIMPKTN